jgi:outer membrane protein OmpA-like peptidoglycan-associated protein
VKRSLLLLVILFVGCIHSDFTMGTIPYNTTCLAVFPFDLRYEAAPSGEILSEFVALELSQSGAAGVLGPQEAIRIFKEANDPLPPSVDPYWARELGRKVGVDGAVFGSLNLTPILRGTRDEDRTVLVNVDVYMLSVKDGVVRWTFGTKVEVAQDSLTPRLNKLASQIVDSFNLQPANLIFKSKAGCWRAPQKVAREIRTAAAQTAVSAPAPTPIPRLLLTPKQAALLKKFSQPGRMALPGSIFEERSDRLTKEGILALRDLGQALKDDSAPSAIEIGGHLDATEDASKDLAQSKARAQAVKTYLVNMGIEPERLTVVGFGGTKPKVPNLFAKSRIVNRRTEIASLDRRKR